MIVYSEGWGRSKGRKGEELKGRGGEGWDDYGEGCEGFREGEKWN